MVAKKENPALDFEGLYRTYPRREGKAAGMKKLRSTIKTEAEYLAFKGAMEAYIKLVKDRKSELQYIKQWVTFVNNWTDYLEDHSTPPSSPLDQLQRVLKGEL